MLNPEVLARKDEIRDQLLQPYLIIENALKPEVAERLYVELLASADWKKQDITYGEFSFKREGILAHGDTAPPAVKELYAYLLSNEIKQWFSDVSGRHCDSFRGSATIFNKHDNISEHHDRYIYEEPGEPRYSRALTFNYYLSKEWSLDWGGGFVWKQPYAKISPGFNRLILFLVTTNSHHWVEPVIQQTNNKRLSITGWYLSEIKKENFKLAI